MYRFCEIDESLQELSWINTNIPKNWPSKGNIKFNNFSVKYKKEMDFVLKNLNFEITANEKIGIVGRTGSGKQFSNY
jgi:ABC-type multidrug transport system fused ATPase/permease subunit